MRGFFLKEYTKLDEKWKLQNELRTRNRGILPDTTEARKTIIGSPPPIIGSAIVVEAKLVEYQRNYLDNFRNLKPLYFFPCSKHNLLQRKH